MPNRLIREGLMESETVLSLPVEGRWLFVIILLSADDIGLFEATEFKLARRADVNREIAAKLLQLLMDAGLVRLYEVEGKRYGFIPKFRQRLQIKHTRYPSPPASLYADDPDALNKFSHLATDTTVGAPVGSSCIAVGQRSESKVEQESEMKVSESQNPSGSSPSRRRRRSANLLPRCPFERIIAAYNELIPELPAVRIVTAGGKREKAIAKLWEFVLTSRKANGDRRATTVEEGLAWFRDYFTRARDNDWIMGREKRGSGHENWEADIDYLCSEAGMKRVIEKTKERA
jgi:hypothetical protein